MLWSTIYVDTKYCQRFFNPLKNDNKRALTKVEMSNSLQPTADTTSHLKKRILVQDQGGYWFQTGGILKYVEDLKPGSNAEIGPKDFFEIACNLDVISNTTVPQAVSLTILKKLAPYSAANQMATGQTIHFGLQ